MVFQTFELVWAWKVHYLTRKAETPPPNLSLIKKQKKLFTVNRLLCMRVGISALWLFTHLLYIQPHADRILPFQLDSSDTTNEYGWTNAHDNVHDSLTYITLLHFFSLQLWQNPLFTWHSTLRERKSKWNAFLVQFYSHF
jgi:hypothetical protein